MLSGQDAWRPLLQTLRTKVFLSLSDESSAELASTMCGKILRLSPSYSFTESAKPGFSVITARARGAKGTLGTSKSYREQREPLFHPRAFSLLENCQAIILPYDGINAQPATRVYLKPHYLTLLARARPDRYEHPHAHRGRSGPGAHGLLFGTFVKDCQEFRV